MKTYSSIQFRTPFALKMAASFFTLLLMMAISSPASHASGTTKIDFVAAETLAPTGPPGRVWVSDDGVQHIRDLPVAGPVWGDINGTLKIVSNRNLNLLTGHGTAFGTAVLHIEWNGLVGTFEGRSEWKIEGFRVVTGQFVGHGTGDFAGMQMMANFFQTPTGTPLIGTILIPSGE